MHCSAVTTNLLPRRAWPTGRRTQKIVPRRSSTLLVVRWEEAADAEIGAQDAMPLGMVLAVERQMATSIGDRRRGLSMPARAAASVYDLDLRRKEHVAPERAYRRTKINILRVQEEALIEAPDGVRVSPPHQQTGAADPVDRALSTRLALSEPGQPRYPVGMRAHEALLPQLS